MFLFLKNLNLFKKKGDFMEIFNQIMAELNQPSSGSEDSDLIYFIIVVLILGASFLATKKRLKK